MFFQDRRVARRRDRQPQRQYIQVAALKLSQVEDPPLVVLRGDGIVGRLARGRERCLVLARNVLEPVVDRLDLANVRSRGRFTARPHPGADSFTMQPDQNGTVHDLPDAPAPGNRGARRHAGGPRVPLLAGPAVAPRRWRVDELAARQPADRTILTCQLRLSPGATGRRSALDGHSAGAVAGSTATWWRSLSAAWPPQQIYSPA